MNTLLSALLPLLLSASIGSGAKAPAGCCDPCGCDPCPPACCAGPGCEPCDPCPIGCCEAATPAPAPAPAPTGCCGGCAK